MAAFDLDTAPREPSAASSASDAPSLRPAMDPAAERLAATRAAPAALSPDISWSAGMAALLAAERRALAAALDWLFAADGAATSIAPRRARVALRRVRALLKFHRRRFGPKLSADRAAARAAEETAKLLGRRIAALRDADVLLEEILPAAEATLAALPEPPASGALRPLFSQAAVRRARAEAALLGPAPAEGEPPAALLAGRLMLALADVETRLREREREEAQEEARAKARGPAFRGAPPALKKAAAAALDAASGAVLAWGPRIETLSIDERHELRKDAKMLRYAAAMHAPLFESEATRLYGTALRKLQNAFGALNDAAGAAELRAFAGAGADPAVVEAVIATADSASEAAWPKACERWRRVAEAAPFW